MQGCSNQCVQSRRESLRVAEEDSYGYEPQFGPDYLSFFERIPPLYSRDGKKADIQPNTSHAVDGFYSSDTYADNLLEYLQDWKQEARDKARSGTGYKPFFAYLPFSAPHWPLQCSKEDRDAYAGVYDDGPDALRLRRLERLKALGIYDDAVVPAELIASEATEWDEMSSEEKKLSARSMETYAGMVTRYMARRRCERGSLTRSAWIVPSEGSHLTSARSESSIVCSPKPGLH